MTTRKDPALAIAGPAPSGHGGARTPSTGGRRSSRPEPRRSPQHAHLALEGLRAYRAVLRDEEHRVSYWRRILQTRLDLLSETGIDRPDLERFAEVFSRGDGRNARDVLVAAVPDGDLPLLPDLGRLWATEVDPDDVEGCRALVRSLAQAERDISTYRAAVIDRLDHATSELIARYREDPTLCLSILPGLTPSDIEPEPLG